MKKFVAMLLALCMVFCLCACGSGEKEADVQTGTLSGFTWENTFLGIGCKLDESWTYASEEELAQMIGQTAEMFDEEYAEQLKNADMFYDMMAVTENGLVSINVIIQNIGLIYGTALSEDKYLELAKEQMEEQFGQTGAENVEVERITRTFAGAEHEGILVSCTIQGVPYYCTQMCIKQGKYIGSVSLCSFSEDLSDFLIGYFYGLDA